MSDGRIYASHECHCARCGQPALGLGYTHADAKAELRRIGWAMGVKDGLRVWFCDECVLLGWNKARP